VRTTFFLSLRRVIRDLVHMEHQDLLAGFVRLHILHHAAEGDLYGQWMIEELGRHGYKLSAGTLYPMLHAMERRGYLTSRTERAGRSQRRIYRATPLGCDALALARERMRELFHEVLPREEPDHGSTSHQ
jgi:PadR family transcriptional regulator, regulatory protein PadR